MSFCGANLVELSYLLRGQGGLFDTKMSLELEKQSINQRKGICLN